MSGRRRYIVVEWSGGGGIGHYSFLLADALARTGTPTTLATRRRHELDGSVPTAARVAGYWPQAPRRLRGRPRTVAIALGWAAGWLRVLGLTLAERLRGRPPVVHVQAPETSAELAFLLALRLLAGRLVVTAHNAVPNDKPGYGRFIHRGTYRLPHTIVAHNESEAAVVRSLAGRGPTVGVIPHGTYNPVADAFPPCAGGDAGTIRVAHLGTLRPYKGFDTVVEAFRAANAVDPTLRLRVVGKPSDEAEVRRLLDSLPVGSVSADLRYLTIAELVGETRAADVLLLGHRRSSESGILLLALGAGTPVVGPAIAGIARLLSARPAWLYPAGDARAAGEALVGLAAELRVDREALRAAARAIADRSAPSWSEVAEAHLDLIGRESDDPIRTR